MAPAELEAVLLGHSDVTDSGVIGLPHPEAGEVPHAWVVRTPGSKLTEQQLQQYLDGKKQDQRPITSVRCFCWFCVQIHVYICTFFAISPV